MTNKKECAGSYSVSGYTRADGTKVSGYTRTCGAAHNSNSSGRKALSQEEKMQRRADILYSTMSSKNNISKTKHNPIYELAVDNVENQFLKKLGELVYGKETVENLLMSKTKSYMNTKYSKEHVIFNNYKEVNTDLQDYFKNKITEQLELKNCSPEYREKILETTKGIYLDAESDSSKKLINVLLKEPGFMELLNNSIDKMKKRITVDGSFNFKDKNFYNALGKADIKFMHINRFGDIDLLLTDVYDFNKNSKSDLVQVGRERQERGEITPYFIMYHVIIPKNSKVMAND